jgi:hypothetical protein
MLLWKTDGGSMNDADAACVGVTTSVIGGGCRFATCWVCVSAAS